MSTPIRTMETENPEAKLAGVFPPPASLSSHERNEKINEIRRMVRQGGTVSEDLLQYGLLLVRSTQAERSGRNPSTGAKTRSKKAGTQTPTMSLEDL